MFGGFQTLLCQQLVCLSHVAIAQLMSVTVLSLQTRLCFLSVTSLSLHWTQTRSSVPLLSLQCAIVTWRTLCNDSNSSAQVCDGNSEIGRLWTYYCTEDNTILSISIICPKHFKMIKIVSSSVTLKLLIFRAIQINPTKFSYVGIQCFPGKTW